MIITIDGPAGAGKSTVAKIVAQKLDFSYLDSGAIYRTLTLACLKEKIKIEDENEVLKVLKKHSFEFKEIVVEGNRHFVCYLNGVDVSEEIRSPEVSRSVSIVARHPKVREEMIYFQRKFAEAHDVVCDGRDMGSYVFKDADFKFFLTADPKVRAQRRFKELALKGLKVTFDEVYENIAFRDKVDSSREASPLVPAPDAHIIDTTMMNPEEVADLIIEIVRSKKR